jgi:reverse gyrase
VVVVEERCPTCNGSGHITRADHRWPCPTCSPASNKGVPYPRPGDEMQSGALRYLRWATSFLGAAAFVVVVALLVKLLWH